MLVRCASTLCKGDTALGETVSDGGGKVIVDALRQTSSSSCP